MPTPSGLTYCRYSHKLYMADPGLEGYGEGIVHMYLYNMYNAGMIHPKDRCKYCRGRTLIWKQIYGKFKRVCTECDTIIEPPKRPTVSAHEVEALLPDPIDMKQWNKRALDTVERISKRKFYS